MSGPRGGEKAARIRAARGYAGLKQPELAKALGVSVETVSRLENGRTTIGSDTLERVGCVCQVPPAFMEAGFAPLERPISDMEARVYNLERRLDALSADDRDVTGAGFATLAPELLEAARAVLQAQGEADSGRAEQGHRAREAEGGAA